MSNAGLFTFDKIQDHNLSFFTQVRELKPPLYLH